MKTVVLSLVVCVILSGLFSSTAAAAGRITKIFSFSAFHQQDKTIRLFGDAEIIDGLISLTKPQEMSAGAVIFNRKIGIFDSRTAKNPTFTTSFSFRIKLESGSSSSGGIMFFLSTELPDLGNADGFLGLGDTSNYFGVEFDTSSDADNRNNNHIAVHINGTVSLTTWDPQVVKAGHHMRTDGINLSSGDTITAWLSLQITGGGETVLLVYLSLTRRKPKLPGLRLKAKVSDYLHQPLWVGLSGSTDSSAESKYIESWNFQLTASNPKVTPTTPTSSQSDDFPPKNGEHHPKNLNPKVTRTRTPTPTPSKNGEHRSGSGSVSVSISIVIAMGAMSGCFIIGGCFYAYRNADGQCVTNLAIKCWGCLKCRNENRVPLEIPQPQQIFLTPAEYDKRTAGILGAAVLEDAFARHKNMQDIEHMDDETKATVGDLPTCPFSVGKELTVTLPSTLLA